MVKLVIILLLLSTKAFATDPPFQLYDEGILQGTIYKLNCVGSSITCTKIGTTGIITIESESPGQLQFLGNDLTFNGTSLTFNP